MKKILLIILVFIIVFIIYYLNLDKKVYFLSLGDYLTVGNENSNYQQVVNDYLKDEKLLEKNVVFGNSGDYRIIDMINDINDNITFYYNGNQYKLDNVLIKADIITLSIGMNDLLYNRLVNDDGYEYVDEVMKDLEDLFKLLRNYSKEKIFIFNYYGLNSKELSEYTNNKLNHLAHNYDIKVIDISDVNDNLINKIYPNDNYYQTMGIKINKLLKTIY